VKVDTLTGAEICFGLLESNCLSVSLLVYMRPRTVGFLLTATTVGERPAERKPSIAVSLEVLDRQVLR
jgi:positive regulator of sigma E activity